MSAWLVTHDFPRANRALPDDAQTSALALCGDIACRCSQAGSDNKPQSVVTQAAPKAATLRGCDCGVTFADEGGDLRGVIDGILLCGGELRLAGTTILDEVVKGLEISSGNLRDRGGREVA
jgi:hypothetical protein